LKADALLGKLDGVQGRGPVWRAICPAHESKHRTRSLKVNEGDDGRVLVYCFAGCGIEAILGAVGMDTADLFPDKPKDFDDRNRPAPVRKPWTAREACDVLSVELAEVFFLLAAIGGGKQISRKDRERCAALSVSCAALFQEVSKP
jgi:hypothetical protein